jgi:hypothetical protein
MMARSKEAMRVEVTVVDMPEMTVLGMRKKGRYEAIGPLIPELCRYAASKKVDLSGPPAFVCHEMTPEDAQKAFLEANPQLGAGSIQIVCSRDVLKEVRICLTKDLSPRPCSRNEQNRQSCSYGTLTVPPVRGGGR